IDSLLVGTILPRKVHYLANASLFRNRILGHLLLRVGAIPVYRRHDDASRADLNREMFDASRRALLAGEVLAIYPEGTTHAETRVQRIRTGAARIALDYERARAADPAQHLPALSIIPVGLSFEARKAFRGRVLVAFGSPLPAPAPVPKAPGDGAAVQALTDGI